VLYRTNSQSRLVEEALRRYNIKYTMVGGFSFYERAEIKDLLCYLRLVRNPHDSMALQRVVNTPTRGIGATTLATLERLALETGVSTWEAIGAAIKNRLIPTRALMALESFRGLIIDAQAMMDPDFAGKLSADVAAPAEASAEEDAGDTDFSFGAAEETPAEVAGADFSFGANESQMSLLDSSHFSPFAAAPKKAFLKPPKKTAATPETAATDSNPLTGDAPTAGFRAPGDAATLPELIRFLIDRTGYIKALETEGTPEAFSRIENLKELANAARDAEERGETLAEFLDHAALASDTDQIDPDARVTLMTLHAAKGLEFPLVFLAGLEEGLFPHSRTLMNPEELEEERRLCYVGMTRAMNTLVLTRAHYRRRYGNDAPEASVPSRFLEEVPNQLVENLSGNSPAWSTPAYSFGGRGGSRFGNRAQAGTDYTSRHYNYEDESQERPAFGSGQGSGTKNKSAGAPPDSIDNIARFFGGKGSTGKFGGKSGSFARPTMDVAAPSGAAGLNKGQRVRHSKYGEGTVLYREGDGDDAKVTVMFPRHGMKKLMEKFANLEKL